MPSLSSEQLQASDPTLSVFVSANAGAGKTSVLAARVMRLLLSGADPARILCVTYTKAAAANMQNRVFDRLGEWVALDDAALTEALTSLEGEAPDAHRLRFARRLFARAIETPGGLKIQTIHGFCQRLLQQFPFEAAVPARFELLEDASERQAMHTTVVSLLRSALDAPHSDLGRAFATVAERGAEETFRKLLAKAIAMLRKAEGEPEQKFAASRLRQLLGVPADATVGGIERAIVEQGFPAPLTQELIAWLSSGSARDQGMGALLAKAGDPASRSIRDYLAVFFTKEGKPRSDKGHYCTDPIQKTRPDLYGAMLAERARVVALRSAMHAARIAEQTEALMLLARTALARYTALKRTRGVLDYEDLIQKTAALLTADSAAWVRFKLDNGIDHVLVDEAQDTSPAQWRIIKALTDDFFSGDSARSHRLRTVFAVGDEKQSIFAFNGARPDAFADAKEHYQRQIAPLATAESNRAPRFKPVPLLTSYRTVPDVLSFVDHVFSGEEHRKGLSSDNAAPQHHSNRLRAPGLVEIWPDETSEKQDKVDPTAPVDEVPPNSAHARLADRIARRIAFWQRTGARFADDGALISPGDVLILVRNRGAVFNTVLRSLKQLGVPVAGADRLRLSSQIVVDDLLALGQVMLLPEDDLALAGLLRSPLFDIPETRLLTLAAGRSKQESLAAALDREAESDAALATISATLHHWRQLSRRLDPFGFYTQLLSAEGCRRLLTQRLGPEAEEAMGVFLAELRQWQSSNPPSLFAFLAAMASFEGDVKRDLEEAHGRVRVMTIHAAKGLEARIVFLADLHTAPLGSGKTEPLLLLDPDDPASMALMPSKLGETPVVTAAKETAQEALLEEHRRLLYVGLTRARDRLYIAGATGVNGPPKGSWGTLIREATDGMADLQTLPDDEGRGDVQRYEPTPKLPVEPMADVMKDKAPVSLPGWLHQPVAREKAPLPPVLPSRLQDAAEVPQAIEASAPSAQDARIRGDLIHLLLEHLPDIAPSRRADAGVALLAARWPGMADARRQEALNATMAVLADDTLAPLFAPGSRAEIAIAGKLTVDGKERDVSGRMDRLVVMSDRIVVADFKTGRPPADPRLLPAGYQRQLDLYRRLLAHAYPDRRITAAVVWTEGPSIVWLPEHTAAPDRTSQMTD